MSTKNIPRGSHLIRFLNNGAVCYGNTFFFAEQKPQNIAAIAASGKLKARIINNNTLSTKCIVTDKKMAVKKLLKPLTQK